MKNLKRHFFFWGAILIGTSIFSQAVVTIDHKTQKYIGDISEFQRYKYLNIHGYIDDTDPELRAFRNEFNLGSNYRGARILDSPAKNKNGVFPAVKKNFSGVRDVHPRVSSTDPYHFFYDETVDYATVDMTGYIDAFTTYIRDYYCYEDNDVPMYFEPLNEPMVQSRKISTNPDAINDRIIELHRVMGKKIHEAPELANMKVMGYASAHPEFESNNFMNNWDTKFRKFIDETPDEIDILSLHLYDGSGVNNKSGRRSGSNVEAILDILEAYSKLSLNKVKPIAITEFGRLVPDQPGFGTVAGTINYEPVTNAQALRSQNHMLMSFIERGNDIELTIPFTMQKQKPTGTYSKSSLWFQESNPTRWVYTPRVNLFRLWKDVKGNRVRVYSSNIDVQTQAFVNEKQLYVVLNNLNDNPQIVNLKLLDKDGVESVDIRSLKVYEDQLPELTDETLADCPENITLQYGETVVLTYHFSTPVAFDNKIVSNKYYANKYLQSISSGVNSSFSISDVKVGNGDAILRVGVAREHGKSLNPTISINGNQISIKGDVIRGYDQSTRSQFFGTMEIPVSIKLLNEGTNTIDIKFPDSGGQISSVILQVNIADNPLSDYSGIFNAKKHEHLNLFPNPVESGQKLILSGCKPNAENTVFSLTGERLFTSKENLIDTSDFKPGVYIVYVKDGDSTKSSKLIVR